MEKLIGEERISVIELKATEDWYPLYKSVGFEDVVAKYHNMRIVLKWRFRKGVAKKESVLDMEIVKNAESIMLNQKAQDHVNGSVNYGSVTYFNRNVNVGWQIDCFDW